MTPKADSLESLSYSSLGFTNVPDRSAVFKNTDQWLKEKRASDGAEGLWRIYDDLYDLEGFIDRHPGGKFWLETTKDSDITEAFESHHISIKPEEMRKKFYVRKAKTPRNSPYTFAEDGFYKTLKRNVREALKTIPKDAIIKSHIITDSFMVASFALSILALISWSFSLAVVAGIFLSCANIASHNYYHQKDNFRMYYSDIAMLQSREMRILHCLSHHMYTNTVADFQAYFTEPLLQYFPHEKSFMAKFGSWIGGPLIFWPLVFPYLAVMRLVYWIKYGQTKAVGKPDLLVFLLPTIMYVFSGQPLLPTIGMWFFIVAINGFWFAFMGIATTHYHPDIFMDGDEPRPPEEMDWGISQLDTVSDRYEVTGSHFLVMIAFGDHAMHHLFPTFDHGLHQYLYPVVRETMKQFNLDFRMTTQADMLSGYFRRLAKVEPNPNPPKLFVNKEKVQKDLSSVYGSGNGINSNIMVKL